MTDKFALGYRAAAASASAYAYADASAARADLISALRDAGVAG